MIVVYESYTKGAPAAFGMAEFAWSECCERGKDYGWYLFVRHRFETSAA